MLFDDSFEHEAWHDGPVTPGAQPATMCLQFSSTLCRMAFPNQAC